MKCLRFLLTVPICAVAVATASWQSYTSKDGSYSISFPGKPDTLHTTQMVEGHKIPMEITAYGKGQRAYVAMRMDVGSVLPQVKGHEKAMLTFGIGGLTQGKGYKILSDDTFKWNGSPGRHVVLRKAGMEQQFYVVGKNGQMIVIVIGGLPGKTVDSAASKFVSSFKLH